MANYKKGTITHAFAYDSLLDEVRSLLNHHISLLNRYLGLYPIKGKKFDLKTFDRIRTILKNIGFETNYIFVDDVNNIFFSPIYNDRIDNVLQSITMKHNVRVQLALLYAPFLSRERENTLVIESRKLHVLPLYEISKNLFIVLAISL